jgi:hypothetical protein
MEARWLLHHLIEARWLCHLLLEAWRLHYLTEARWLHHLMEAMLLRQLTEARWLRHLTEARLLHHLTEASWLHHLMEARWRTHDMSGRSEVYPGIWCNVKVGIDKCHVENLSWEHLVSTAWKSTWVERGTGSVWLVLAHFYPGRKWKGSVWPKILPGLPGLFLHTMSWVL